jgi:hypothetical protein
MKLTQLQIKLRELAMAVGEFSPILPRYSPIDVVTSFSGFTNSKLSLAVYKETAPVGFAFEQATFMMFLGEQVCPKIFSINDNGYAMEYMYPITGYPISSDILLQLEDVLENTVWNKPVDDIPYAKQIGDESWKVELADSINLQVPSWALDSPCIIHGDPTLDNALKNDNGTIKITDPIPPHRLIRPSIRAIDHGKLLQSFLGWETVLRGMPQIEFDFPLFMQDYDSARRAVFWCIVALRRITLRNSTSSAGKWTSYLAEELKKCEL